MEKAKSLEDFRMPRWRELPAVSLYLEQVLELLEDCLGPYLGSGERKVMTRTMINNYVKLRFIAPPVGRKYDRLTVASLFVIAVLKPVYTMEEIRYLIRLSIGYSDTEAAYDSFCDCVEAAVSHAFHRTAMEKTPDEGDPRQLLWNACNAFACQLYVRRIYLEDAMAAGQEQEADATAHDAAEAREDAVPAHEPAGKQEAGRKGGVRNG